jgi:hypothetical protein
MDVSRHRDYGWQAREVVREVNHQPQLLVRLGISGGLFQHRALVPVVRIVRNQTVVADSWFTEISADGRELVGYFHRALPAYGVIEFGYPDQPLTQVPMRFDVRHVSRLDRKRLGREVVVTDAARPAGRWSLRWRRARRRGREG